MATIAWLVARSNRWNLESVSFAGPFAREFGPEQFPGSTTITFRVPVNRAGAVTSLELISTAIVSIGKRWGPDRIYVDAGLIENLGCHFPVTGPHRVNFPYGRILLTDRLLVGLLFAPARESPRREDRSSFPDSAEGWFPVTAVYVHWDRFRVHRGGNTRRRPLHMRCRGCGQVDSCRGWNVRRRWPELKAKLQDDLLHGTFRFSPLRRIQVKGEAIELWSSLDALVLKAMAMVFNRMLDFPKSCYHVPGKDGEENLGAKAAVRHICSQLPSNQFRLPQRCERLLRQHRPCRAGPVDSGPH